MFLSLVYPHLQYPGCPRPQDARLRGPNVCHLYSRSVAPIILCLLETVTWRGSRVWKPNRRKATEFRRHLFTASEKSVFKPDIWCLGFHSNLRQTLTQINDCPDKTLWDTKLLFIIIVQVRFSNWRSACTCQKSIFKELYLINYTHVCVVTKFYKIFKL